VALRGSRWFLGQIYGYPHEGLYFGVPIANFLGWTVVGIVIFCAFQIVDSLLENPAEKPYFNKRHVPCKPLMGPALYFCTMIFNVTITFYIGEYLLGLISLSILGFLLCTVGYRLVKSEEDGTVIFTDNRGKKG
jgi:putative membrane protein